MATTTAGPRASRRSFRPLLFVLSAVVIVAGTYGVERLGLLRGTAPATTTGQPVVAASAPAPGAATGSATGVAAVPAPDGPATDPAATTADLDKAIGVWSGNLRRDPADFISAENLALVYYTRGRLTGNADDYARAQEAVDAGLAAYPDDTGA
ncbi:MAG TPA: hypothetical protein VLR93_05680, partial [Patescibacteria group bacterium]|nr:hypothetical protein [Patescibacteria group bacterium]